MPNPLLDPHLASSKADRKKRQKATELDSSAATERALATIRRSFATQANKASAADRLRAKAISDTMGEFIAAMDEETLAAFFLALERLATSANRKRIATHPLRPEIVDDMHAEAKAEEAALKAEAEAAALAAEAKGLSADKGRKAEAPAVQADAQKATPQPGAQDGAALN